MSHSKPGALSRSQQRQRALSRWDNEGGAGPCGAQQGASLGEVQFGVPKLTNAELVQLQIRMIALENLVIALLAETSDRQLDRVREMAAYIVPRPGFTPHRLTIHAADEMISMVKRAGQFRVTSPS